MSKIGKFVKITTLGLLISAFALTPLAQAKQKYKNKHYSDHRYERHDYARFKYNKRKYKKHYNRRHNSYYGSYNVGYSNNYYGGYSKHRRHDNSGAIALGVLTGGLLFYALNSNNKRRDYDNRTVYVQQQQPAYVPPTQQQWTRPAQPQNSSCLQTREYQTTITVGGQTVPAYGQSCLQPDGSWKLGPAIPEPGY